MSDLGDRALGSTVTFQFTCAVNGVPTNLAGSPVISAYGSNSSTPITAGVTLTTGYNSTAGLHNVAIVASTGNGFAAGIDYSVVVTTGTLAGISMVGYQVGTFSINLGNTGNLDSQAISAAGGLQIDAGGNVYIDSNIKKNTAQANFLFVMTSSTTGLPQTGLTVTAQRSLDGGAFAACANSPSEIANGTYAINLAATDTNANHVMLMFTATGANQLNIEIITQP